MGPCHTPCSRPQPKAAPFHSCREHCPHRGLNAHSTSPRLSSPHSASACEDAGKESTDPDLSWQERDHPRNYSWQGLGWKKVSAQERHTLGKGIRGQPAAKSRGKDRHVTHPQPPSPCPTKPGCPEPNPHSA